MFGYDTGRELTCSPRVECASAYSMNGDPATIEALIDGGASVNGAFGSMSPLQMAIANGKIEAVKVFIKKGARVGLRDPEFARSEGHPEIAKILANAAVRQRGGF